ncbi:MAG: ADP-ribosylglycohydrolase family protein [Cuspidothrix sp.]
MLNTAKTLSGFMGVCVGDALGVPVEFSSRAERIKSPVTKMLGYGTWNQPPGTWSDDSSLMLCLADSLCSGYDVDDIAKSFCRWYRENYWTAHGQVFDIDTLEASIWCLLNSSYYAEAVIKAVNLGGDTDTTAAVTGGLAGIYYGIENIPPEWVEQTARKQDIIDLSHRFAAVLPSRS